VASDPLKGELHPPTLNKEEPKQSQKGFILEERCVHEYKMIRSKAKSERASQEGSPNYSRLNETKKNHHKVMGSDYTLLLPKKLNERDIKYF